MEEFQGITPPPGEEDVDSLRRGPWTSEEDILLINCIAVHGEGKWNSLARSAGLRRTGKSCRLRWLNYLRPDVRRGNITPEEQLLILELHSRWGNKWSKIAQYLPGRTDNEIKNYWRTRVQKHAKQLKCDVDSKQFEDVMRRLWRPRLLERIRAASGEDSLAAASDLPEADRAVPEVLVNLSPEYTSSAAGSLSTTTTADDSSPSMEFSPPPASVQGGGGEISAGLWTESPPFATAGGHPDLGLPELDQIVWGEASLWGMEEDIWLQPPF